MNISKEFEVNYNYVKNSFSDCSDFISKKIQVSGKQAAIFSCDGISDNLLIGEGIIEPLVKYNHENGDLISVVVDEIIQIPQVNRVKAFREMFDYIMAGFCVLVIDGYDEALAFGVQGGAKRSVEQPSNECNVRGAKDCFVEVLNDNKALLRKRLKTHHFKMKQIKLGHSATTNIMLGYVDNRVDMNVVRSIEQGLIRAGFDYVCDYGEIVPFVSSGRKTIFHSTGVTERPDVAVSKLMEGRVIIIVDGSPYAVYLPYLFSDNFQSVDDYDNPPFYSGFIRILKYFSFILSIFLPGVYVAIGTFHQELIPTNLLFTIAAEEITTPFSLTVEAIMLLLLYEIMREAGLRLPQAIGHAVSIIGGIIIGETTVTAGIVGAPMLVVIALTAISSYVVYPLYESVSVLRFLFILVGGFLGMYGIVLIAGVVFVNICSVTSFGVPLSSPISPLDKNSLGDIFYRESWKSLSKRKVRVFDLRGVNNDKGK